MKRKGKETVFVNVSVDMKKLLQLASELEGEDMSVLTRAALRDKLEVLAAKHPRLRSEMQTAQS